MRTWKTLIATMMLALMLWAGGLAHASEPIECIPATAEAAGHYEGDDDQLPSDHDEGVVHHHAGCSGHQLLAAAALPAVVVDDSSATVPAARPEAGIHGHLPDRQLRPPIA